MNEYLFGVRNGRLAPSEVQRRERIAQRHGAEFIHARLPEGWRSWFTAPNRGEPFDGDIRKAVEAEVHDG